MNGGAYGALRVLGRYSENPPNMQFGTDGVIGAGKAPLLPPSAGTKLRYPSISPPYSSLILTSVPLYERVARTLHSMPTLAGRVKKGCPGIEARLKPCGFPLQNQFIAEMEI